jgi:hypothetical protein
MKECYSYDQLYLLKTVGILHDVRPEGLSPETKGRNGKTSRSEHTQYPD